MIVQNLIYNLKTFKIFCLVYLLESKFQTNKTSLIDAFTFNNNRVKFYQKSFSIRQKSLEAMDNLNKIITHLNSKFNENREKLFSNNKLKLKRLHQNINNKEKSNTNIDNKINTNNEKNIQREGFKTYLEPEELKEIINSMLYDNSITKIYIWLHNHSANHKNIDKDAKKDFYVETIKVKTKI